jgi:hypothetical protein
LLITGAITVIDGELNHGEAIGQKALSEFTVTFSVFLGKDW